MIIKTINELDASNVSGAGGKGASLGEMTQAGIPVPPGFVILATAFDQFLQSTDLNVEIDAILHAVNTDIVHTVDSASEKIQALILNAKIPDNIANEVTKAFTALGSRYVAVRSSATSEDSATAAWAGQLDSFLNTTEDNLLENIKKCWASLFTPRAIFYRFEKGLHGEDISVAVVVQKMIQSEISGIAFSVHPVTEDKNQLIIEAALGLGEAIVSGQITPDSYVVEKQPKKILDKNIFTQKKGLFKSNQGGNEWRDIKSDEGAKQVLSDDQILEFSELLLTIESHYGFPVDIEFAVENNKFYIVQSRSITTLTSKQSIKQFGEASAKPIPHFKKDDYMLSFWVQGVSVFVTDIHVDVYDKLEVLYIIDQGMFKQYFTKKAYQRALDQGLVFYSDKHAFDNYQKALSDHNIQFKEFFKKKIKNKKTVSKDTVIEFFEYTKKLCGEYNKMNFEFTDKAFAYQKQNKIIKHNLSKVATFKDKIRAFMNTVLFESDGYSDQLFTTIKKQFDVPVSILENLTQHEILNLFDGWRPAESIVKKRQKVFVESYDLNGFYEGEDAQAIIDEFKEKAVDTEIIQGQTANGGKVVGTVKIIPVDYSDPERVDAEMQKMNDGDILVAETTAPELMIACKKAKAIITDMGGLMSHAAIVSREFNIPCIVGTSNASKVLKYGDKVEVDAEKGIVKILTKHRSQTEQMVELNLSEWEFEFQQRDGHPLIMADQWCKSLYNNFVEELNLDVKPYDYLFTGTYRGYVKAEQKQKLLEVFFRAVDSQEYLNFVFEKTMSRVTELVDFSQTVKESFPATNKEILKTWQEFNALFLKVIPWFWIPYYLSEKDVLTNKVKEGLKKYNKKVAKVTDFNNALALLCFPTKNNKLQDEQAALYELVKFARDNKDYQSHSGFNKLAESYLNKFGWTKTFIELPKEPLTKEELLEKVSDSLNSNFIEEYELQKTQKQKDREMVSSLSKIINKDQELTQAVSNAQHLGWMLSASVEDSLMALANLIPFYKQIAKAMGVDYKDWAHFTIDEIENLLKGEQLDFSLKDRRVSYVYIMEAGERRIYFGKEAQQYTEYIDETINKVDTDVSEIKGTPTSPGFVKGKVRLALSPDESKNVQKGEVLVTGMTSPDYVPAMKRAGAIVTDEGGLLSHAAIISRELGKPCIVGTKIATQVLQDGDEVEVDAEKGIVKIL